MTTDLDAAVAIARGAGAVLQEVRAAHRDLDGRALKDLGDRSAQAWIAERLAAEFPGDAVLSEEAADAAGSGSGADRLLADRVWIIDPLDGTREYSEGRADWAVHVALWERSAGAAGAGAGGGSGAGSAGAGGGLTVGAVAIPDEDLVINSGPGAELPARTEGPLRIAVSRSRPPELVHAVVERLGARGVECELVPMGSAGVKIASVARGLTDAYVHGGGQYQWDSAAPVAAARAYGLWTSRLDGSPLVYNGADAWLPDLVVCRREFSELLLAAIARS